MSELTRVSRYMCTNGEHSSEIIVQKCALGVDGGKLSA